MIHLLRQWTTKRGLMLRVMACLLGLALVVNPLGAVAHTLSHLDIQSTEKQALIDGCCVVCAAYSHLTGAAPLIPTILAALNGSATALPVLHSAFIDILPCPYQGRAPPFPA